MLINTNGNQYYNIERFIKIGIYNQLIRNIKGLNNISNLRSTISLLLGR
jgi:hypothetical protein